MVQYSLHRAVGFQGIPVEKNLVSIIASKTFMSNYVKFFGFLQVEHDNCFTISVCSDAQCVT